MENQPEQVPAEEAVALVQLYEATTQPGQAIGTMMRLARHPSGRARAAVASWCNRHAKAHPIDPRDAEALFWSLSRPPNGAVPINLVGGSRSDDRPAYLAVTERVLDQTVVRRLLLLAEQEPETDPSWGNLLIPWTPSLEPAVTLLMEQHPATWWQLLELFIERTPITLDARDVDCLLPASAVASALRAAPRDLQPFTCNAAVFDALCRALPHSHMAKLVDELLHSPQQADNPVAFARTLLASRGLDLDLLDSIAAVSERTPDRDTRERWLEVVLQGTGAFGMSPSWPVLVRDSDESEEPETPPPDPRRAALEAAAKRATHRHARHALAYLAEHLC